MPRCKAKRRDGSPCTLQAREGSEHCWAHDPRLKDRRREGSSKGGTRSGNRSTSTLPTDAPDLPLATVADVVTALGVTINQVRRGQVDPKTGNCLFVGLGVLLKALEGSDLERRLAELEARQAQRHHTNGRHA